MNVRWGFFGASVSALLFCFAGSGSDAIFSDVEISSFDQSALELSFRVSWETAGGGGGGGGGGDSENSASAAAASTGSTSSSDKVDVWLLTRQPNPSSWMETILVQVGWYSTTRCLVGSRQPPRRRTHCSKVHSWGMSTSGDFVFMKNISASSTTYNNVRRTRLRQQSRSGRVCIFWLIRCRVA